MKKNKRKYNPGLKAAIAATALRGKYSVKEIAEHFGVNPSLVHAWRQLLVSTAPRLFSDGKADDLPDAPSVKELDRKLAELQAEQEWMRRILAALPLRARRSFVEVEDSDLPILGQARLLGLHRSGIYYQNRRAQKVSEAPPAQHPDLSGGEKKETAVLDENELTDRDIPRIREF